MRWLIAVLVLIILLLQYRLWVGEGSVAQKVELEKKLTTQQEENDRLRARNQTLVNEVNDLKSGLEGVEERARHELGMVKEGETFYMLLDENNTSVPNDEEKK